MKPFLPPPAAPPGLPPYLPSATCTPILTDAPRDADAFARVAFVPESFVMRPGDVVSVNVSLSDPIIAPASTPYRDPFLHVAVDTLDTRLLFSPQSVDWVASQWAETRELHVSFPQNPYGADSLNLTRACVASNSELYMGYVPRFDVSIDVPDPPPQSPPSPSPPPFPPSPPPLRPPHDPLVPALTIGVAASLGSFIFVTSVTVAFIVARNSPRAPRATDVRKSSRSLGGWEAILAP